MVVSEDIPALYSFISYRQERVGGFIFNPYLSRELALDRFEMYVVERCDGKTSLGEITVELCRLFCSDWASTELRLHSTLEKLQDYCAIKWQSSHGTEKFKPAFDPQQARNQWNECEQAESGYLTAPLSILWEITHACNLSCVHCLSASGKTEEDELTTLEAERLIDELADLRIFSVTLGGGEPLVRPDVFDLITMMTRKNLAVRLSTNGYAVTPETLNRLADLNVFNVQVSVDGLEATHDFLRQHRGAFKRAVNALKLFKEAGYHTFMTVTASAQNINEIPALVDLAVDMGVTTFKVGPAVPLGRAVDHPDLLQLSYPQLKELAFLMREKAHSLENKIEFQIDGLFPWLLEPAPANEINKMGDCGPGCSAAISQVVVAWNGDVFPCPYIRTQNPPNLRQARLAEIWNNEDYFGSLRRFDPSKINGKCPACGYRPESCTGGCRGAALAATGSLYGQDPHCWF